MVNFKNEKMGKNKIACFILTFNRLHLLKKCVEGVRNQSYTNFDFYVVDNASTDGTAMWLSQQEDIQKINISKNDGMANGFSVGMQELYDKGYDWIWMMDDDGVADKRQLEELLNKTFKSNLYFTNALVCDINNPDKLAFGAKKRIDAQQKELILGYINPFNGTFIHRRVIEEIGNIKREMYMYGCETEYQLRAIKNGFKVATVTAALHYHPQNKKKSIPIIPFISKGRIYDVNSIDDITFSRMIRNQGYIDKVYMGNGILLTPIRYCLYYLLRFQFKKMYYWISCYRKGIHGDFT